MDDDLLEQGSDIKRQTREMLTGFTRFEKACDAQLKALKAQLAKSQASERAAVRRVATVEAKLSAQEDQHVKELADKDREIARKDREIRKLKQMLEVDEPDDSPQPPKKRRRSNARVISSGPQSEVDEPEGDSAMDQDHRPKAGRILRCVQILAADAYMQQANNVNLALSGTRADGDEDDEVERGEEEEEEEDLVVDDDVHMRDDDAEYQDSDCDDTSEQPPSPIRKSARLANTARRSYAEPDPNALDDDDETQALPDEEDSEETVSAKSSESRQTTPSGGSEAADEDDSTPPTSVIDGDDDDEETGTGGGPFSGREKCHDCADNDIDCFLVSGLEACTSCHDLHIGCWFPQNIATMLLTEAGDGETVMRNG